jgi:hypothetical protein
MATFIKAQAASLTATIVDFAVTVPAERSVSLLVPVGKHTGYGEWRRSKFYDEPLLGFHAHDKKIHYQASNIYWCG